MTTCPMSNFIGNLCMPDPIKEISHLNQIRNFSEEASFYIAMYRQHPVKPVPDPALLLVLNKLWLKQKSAEYPRKSELISCG